MTKKMDGIAPPVLGYSFLDISESLALKQSPKMAFLQILLSELNHDSWPEYHWVQKGLKFVFVVESYLLSHHISHHKSVAIISKWFLLTTSGINKNVTHLAVPELWFCNVSNYDMQCIKLKRHHCFKNLWFYNCSLSF